MAERTIRRATGVVGGPVTFTVDERSGEEYWLSGSLIVVQALLPAVLSGSPVEVELVADSSNVVRRVQAYSVEPNSQLQESADKGDVYIVSRIAAQRKPDGRDEHVEVFLRQLDEEKAYNVFDPFLGAMLVVVFANPSTGPVTQGARVKIDRDDIVSVTIDR